MPICWERQDEEALRLPINTDQLDMAAKSHFINLAGELPCKPRWEVSTSSFPFSSFPALKSLMTGETVTTKSEARRAEGLGAALGSAGS